MAATEPSLRRESTRGNPDRLGSITRRIVYAIALLPIVPAVSVIGVLLIDQKFRLQPFDKIRWFNLFFSILWVGATIAIWRRAIVWTLGRAWLTTLINLIPFVQVIYGQPLWNAGCGSEYALRVGQHEIGIGLWTWLIVWIWWGLERTRMKNENETAKVAQLSMSPTAKRLVASIATIPFLFGSFLVAGLAIRSFANVGEPELVAFAPMALVAILVWVLIWRGAVVWSRQVIGQTLVAAFVCLVIPISALLGLWNSVGDFTQSVLVCLPLVGWGGWMVVTLNRWPISSTIHAPSCPTPHCLRCRYLLTGLTSTRCPECGDEPTIDALWQATAGEL
ncbi:MAG: hypothetical protein IH989_01350 [Planctomycetes bacterium]|nr:hypothetical protein [Planctomycetota bacterium]